MELVVTWPTGDLNSFAEQNIGGIYALRIFNSIKYLQQRSRLVSFKSVFHQWKEKRKFYM